MDSELACFNSPTHPLRHRYTRAELICLLTQIKAHNLLLNNDAIITAEFNYNFETPNMDVIPICVQGKTFLLEHKGQIGADGRASWKISHMEEC